LWEISTHPTNVVPVLRKTFLVVFSRAIKRFELTFVARQLGHQRDRGERGVTLMGALRMLY